MLPIASALCARNVYVLPPNDGITRNVTIFSADSLTRIGTVTAASDAYTALTTPSGSKTYIVGRSGTDTVTVLGPTNTVLTTVNVPGGTSDAALSSDGRKLVLVSRSSSVATVIDTTSDTIQASVQLGGGGVSIAFNVEGTKAFILVPSAQAVVSVDMLTYAPLTLTLPSGTTDFCGIALSPNGYLYASAQNRLYEIDPRTFTLNLATSSQYLGTGGVPQMTPDGTRAVMALINPATAQASIEVVELRNASVIGSGINLQGIRVDRVEVTSSNTAVAYSLSSGQYYNVILTPPYTAQVTAFNGVPSTNNTGLDVSGEIPNAAYTFMAQGNTLFRVTNGSLSVGNQTLPNNAGPVVYAGPASSAPVAQLLAYNQTQFQNLTGPISPLIVRALDAQGFPVSGASIQFTTSNIFNVLPSPSAATTTGQGFAYSTLANPGSSAQIQVTAVAPSQVVQNFSIIVGPSFGGGTGGTGGTGGGSTSNPNGKLEIWDGNGQFVFSTTPAPVDMVVRATDPQGNPVVGVPVTWTVTTATGGSLNLTQNTTDTNGLAANRFLAKFIFAVFQSYEAVTITATTGAGTVTFSAVQIPRFMDPSEIPGIGRLQAIEPLATQVVPEQFTQPEVVVPVGGTLPGVFKYRVISGSGPSYQQPIAGVGVRATTLSATETIDPNNPLPVVVNCDQGQLSGSDGIVTCDLKVSASSRLGQSEKPLRVLVGGLYEFVYPIRVAIGKPATIKKVPRPSGGDSDNQTGRAGTELPFQLVASLTDLAGNPTTGVNVNWEIIAGTGTLVGTVSRSDARGYVSTGLRLGNSPGQVRVRVSVPGDTTVTPLVFTANVELAVGGLRKVSGDNQTATVSTNFAETLVVEVLDTQQRPVPGTTVNFSSNGDITVSGSAVSGSDGRASVTARAGITPGVFTVTATVGSASQTFSLTVRPVSPQIASILNGASNKADNSVAPCSVVTLTGTSFVPNLTGTRTGAAIGRQPTTLEGLTVRFNGILAPIFSVTGSGGGRADQVSVQVPCELLPGSANIEVTSGAIPGSTSVRVTPAAPGIYEEVDAAGTRRAIVLRSNGQQASAANPAEVGETVRILATGLGLVSPNTATNEPGTGSQRSINDIVIGLNNEGISVDPRDTEYAPGFVGVYYVSFRIPLTATRGANRPLVIAASGADGNVVYSAGSSMDIR